MSHSVQKKRIVVAEDDEAVLELLTVRLELAGYHTILARNGYQALERIRATSPDGVVLDIGMPRLDGFHVLTELGRRYRKLPTLVLTARQSKEDVQRAIKLGAFGYLTKPFDEKIFLQRVSRMIMAPTPTPAAWML
jgi:DNA-binding response OmpR family regulator